MEGIKRLSKMLEGQKNKGLIRIVNHLMLQTEMDEAFLNEEKNLKDMAEYIYNTAYKQKTNKVEMIEDEVVFQWAKDYFIKTNKELGIKTMKVEKVKHSVISKVEVKDEEFGSIFDSTDNSCTEKKQENIEQISLFAA